MFNILKIFKKKIKVENQSFFVGCSGSLYAPVAFEVIEGFIVQKSTRKVIEAERR
jgi:hypothetical protein